MTLHLNTRADVARLAGGGFDEIVLATGVTPRRPDIEGIGHARVMGYLDVLRDGKPVGASVAVIGAGGIGFDVSEYLTHTGESASVAPSTFYAQWGIDVDYGARGGVRMPHVEAAPRNVHLLQRKASKVGDGLGKTTGWIHRTSLKARRVAMSSGVSYERIDDAGLHVRIDGELRTLAVDSVVVCAGQEPQRELYDGLRAAGCSVHLIGGAHVAAELDAKRAILQGTTLAASI
ncbi:pyridine nucleotide-disulfide oxidoreductase family protein [Burkholderia pseudomallei TSV44]|nr:pyridine nucleotide-disulfide oxidoreductase family protein [Burkholderia pseudomallei TSV44]